jgi:hypothetical protein
MCVDCMIFWRPCDQVAGRLVTSSYVVAAGGADG